RSFEYVVAAQRDEFTRIYGRDPGRLDGHHHMHLCSNVLLAGLLGSGNIVRRNFSFRLGEKGLGNLLYRNAVDRILARRHRLTLFFFPSPPLPPPERLHRIFALSRQFVVEVETHPYEPAEYAFLTNGGIRELARNCPVAPRYDLGMNENPQP